MRRWPHAEFSRANRTTRWRTSSSMGGRPGWWGYVHFLQTSRRCQASRVAGVTIRCARSSRGSRRASAESTTRSGHDGRGLPTWRRSTATSCRRTKISTFLAALVRASNASQPSTFTKLRYRIRIATAGDHALPPGVSVRAGHHAHEGSGAGAAPSSPPPSTAFWLLREYASSAHRHGRRRRTPTPNAGSAPSAPNAWTGCSSATARTLRESWRSTSSTTTRLVRTEASAFKSHRRLPHRRQAAASNGSTASAA